MKVIALAVVERVRKRQCARIADIKEGDANTKIFHLRVNARRRKKPYTSAQEKQWLGDGTRRKRENHL
jgi:hypothetical protein